jgi:hypothetical protein
MRIAGRLVVLAPCLTPVAVQRPRRAAPPPKLSPHCAFDDSFHSRMYLQTGARRDAAVDSPQRLHASRVRSEPRGDHSAEPLRLGEIDRHATFVVSAEFDEDAVRIAEVHGVTPAVVMLQDDV